MVMHSLTINCANTKIGGLIQDYHTWSYAVNFYNGSHLPRIIASFTNGIPSYYYNEVDKINADSSNIIAIDCIHEGYHGSEIFNQYNNEKTYLFFSDGWWDIEKVELNIKKYYLIHYNTMLYNMINSHFGTKGDHLYLNSEYVFEYPKPSLFTSTIGLKRAIRDDFVDLLINELKSSKYILKYNGVDYGIKTINLEPYKIKLKTTSNFDPYTPIMKSNKTSCLQNAFNVSQSMPIQIYNQSYFNIIVETDIDRKDSFFLTEKTIKCLITGMPFVVYSTSNFLYHLKEKLGFKTYSTIWNEEYDLIDDTNERIISIVELCKTLETFDWHKHKNELQQIGIHNRMNFLKLSKYVDMQFKDLDKIIEDL